MGVRVWRIIREVWGRGGEGEGRESERRRRIR